ncbi:MAG: cytochrome c maturation protein CcmE [Candidatus Lambdaproteobacteria bacterium]|nr:cytochrome c maturation protein CcmE [Candidatus Lambdaproteobacteria bacterium]
MGNHYRVVIGAVIILAILGGILYKGSQSTVFYFTPNEIGQAPERYLARTIRVGGLVVPNSTKWDPDAVTLWFTVTEDFNSGIRVRYAGPKPDMFREGQGVVAEGILDERGLLWASTLLVKHSEDYKVDPKQVTDKKMAYKSLLRE